MYVSRPLQWIYFNMNFHIEHHMYPMVPFHALPQLHAEIKDQLPAPTRGIGAGMLEVVRTMRRQRHEPGYTLPDRVPPGTEWPPAAAAGGSADGAPAPSARARVSEQGMVDVCAVDDIPRGDLVGIEHEGGRAAAASLTTGPSRWRGPLDYLLASGHPVEPACDRLGRYLSDDVDLE